MAVGTNETRRLAYGGFFVDDGSGSRAFVLPTVETVEFERSADVELDGAPGARGTTRSAVYRIDEGDEVYVTGVAGSAAELIQFSTTSGVSANLPSEQLESLRAADAKAPVPCFFPSDASFSVTAGNYEKLTTDAAEGASTELWAGLVLSGGSVLGLILHSLKLL
jgi:hypothetical protein